MNGEAWTRTTGIRLEKMRVLHFRKNGRALRWVVLWAVFSSGGAVSAQVHARQKPASSRTQADSDEKAIQAVEEAARPGAIHGQLMRLAGEYTTTIKFYSQPGMDPEVSTGTATLKGILGGRFIEETNSGESLGQPFAGLRLYGFNKGSHRYEAVWIYNGSTAFLVLDGTSHDGGKTIRYTGAFLGPGGTKQIVHVTFEQQDRDHFVVRLTGDSSAGFAPTVETTYTRKRKQILRK